MQTATRPRAGVMFGITHELDGDTVVPIVREPKLLKIGIGQPKGKSILVYIDPDEAKTGKPWRVVVGHKDGERVTFPCATRAEAEKVYTDQKKKAPVCSYPRKLPFFTFTHQEADGSFEADFDAIAAHGPMPTEVPIVFLDDNPFSGSFQMWSKSQLECSGDGINAMQIPARAFGTVNIEAAKEIRSGEKYFPVVHGCWTTGECPYSKPSNKNGKEAPSACKPSGDLKFQLAKSLRVGGTAYFHTSGIRSIQQMFSALYRFKSLTGGGNQENGYLAGLMLIMKLRPYATNHNGQAATQYGVSLEFRADSIEALQKSIMEQATRFRSAMTIGPSPAPRLIESAAVVEAIESDDDDDALKAQAMAAEFYPEADDEGDESEGGTPEGTVDHDARLDEKMSQQAAEPEPEPVRSSAAPNGSPWGNTLELLNAFTAIRNEIGNDEDFFRILGTNGLDSEEGMHVNNPVCQKAYAELTILKATKSGGEAPKKGFGFGRKKA